MPNNKNNVNALDLLTLTRFDEPLLARVTSLVILHRNPKQAALLLVRLSREGLLQGPLSHTLIKGIEDTPDLSQFEIAILKLERYLQANGKSIATVKAAADNIKILINYLAIHPNPIDFFNVYIFLKKIALSKATFLQGEYPSKPHRVLADLAAMRSPVFPAIVLQKCLAAGLLTGDAAEANYGLVLECAPIWCDKAELTSLFIRYPIEQVTAEWFAELVEATKASIREGTDFSRVHAILSRGVLVANSPAVAGSSNYGRLSSALYKDSGVVNSEDSSKPSGLSVAPV